MLQPCTAHRELSPEPTGTSKFCPADSSRVRQALIKRIILGKWPYTLNVQLLQHQMTPKEDNVGSRECT